jgi:alkylhydroperoxidase family enzyme
MQPRIDFSHVPATALQAMRGLDVFVRSSSLPPALLELVKMRASQINGCA